MTDAQFFLGLIWRLSLLAFAALLLAMGLMLLADVGEPSADNAPAAYATFGGFFLAAGLLLSLSALTLRDGRARVAALVIMVAGTLQLTSIEHVAGDAAIAARVLLGAALVWGLWIQLTTRTSAAA